MGELLDLIKDRNVIPPIIENTDEFNGWLRGYADCQNDIIDIILKYQDDMK